MDPLPAELLRGARGRSRPRAATIPLVSTVTGRLPTRARLGADYWWRNVREPVRFAEAIATLLEQRPTAFLEIGPHPVLSQSLAECLESARVKGSVLCSLRRGRDGRTALLESLAELYMLGSPVEWRQVHQDPATVVALPTYAFQRKRFWLDAAPRLTVREAAPSGTAGHPLIGSRLPCALEDALFENSLDPDKQTWLQDHRVFGEVVVPGSALVAMALSAVDAVQATDGRCSVEHMTFPRALVIPAGESRMVQVIVRAASAGAVSVEISAGPRAPPRRPSPPANGCSTLPDASAGNQHSRPQTMWASRPTMRTLDVVRRAAASIPIWTTVGSRSDPGSNG